MHLQVAGEVAAWRKGSGARAGLRGVQQRCGGAGGARRAAWHGERRAAPAVGVVEGGELRRAAGGATELEMRKKIMGTKREAKRIRWTASLPFSHAGVAERPQGSFSLFSLFSSSLLPLSLSGFYGLEG